MQACAGSLQLLLEEGSVHIDTQCMTKSCSSLLSRTFEDFVADKIFVLPAMPHYSLLRGGGSEKTFQNEGKCVLLVCLDDVVKGEDLLECAVLLREDNLHSQGLCRTQLWKNSGSSKERDRRGSGKRDFSHGLCSFRAQCAAT